jgi:MFS family permease
MSGPIARVYAFSFFDAFILIYPLYTLLFVRSGIPPAGVGVLLGVWSTTAFVLEAPTGVLADRVSRRWLLVTAQALRAAGCGVWLLAPSFVGFLIGFMLWGAKSALTSGTFQAMVYDHLKEAGRAADYGRVIGRTKSASHIGIMLASLAAAGAVKMGGYPLVLGLSIGGCALAAAAIASFPAPRLHSSHEAGQPLAILRDGLKVIVSDGLALTLVVFVAIAHGFGGAIDEYFPIFGSLAPLPLAGVPIFMALISAAQALAALFVHRFERLPLAALYGLFTLTGVLMAAAAVILGLGSLALLCAFSGVYAIVSTHVEVKIQHLVPSAVRATATSVQGFVVEIATLAMYFGFGLVAQYVSYDRAFLDFGLAIVAIGLLYLALGRGRASARPEAA